MSETKTFEGSCHCGAVRFEATMAEPAKAYACNCSICSRAGWLLAFVPEGQFRLLSGKDDLQDYQFNKKHTHHLFCRTCGVRAFSHGQGDKGGVTFAVNLRCIPAINATSLPVENFDGASL